MWMWRVELHGLGNGEPALGLDILGPIIFGRTTADDPTVDVDFTPYGAIDKGVSRQHALIRPTEQRLYLIDLSSTNGTKHNELPVGPGMAVVLQDRDMVALGHLSFEIRILDRPSPPSDSAFTPRDGETRPFS
jgi:pSer/pThr/pTyr-binding forkhead associated (FHA) protein